MLPKTYVTPEFLCRGNYCKPADALSRKWWGRSRVADILPRGQPSWAYARQLVVVWYGAYWIPHRERPFAF